MKQPKVVVAATRAEFVRICGEHKWNRTQIRYVWGKSSGAGIQLRGFCAEDIYPPEVAAEYGLRKRPSLPVPDLKREA